MVEMAVDDRSGAVSPSGTAVIFDIEAYVKLDSS